MTPEQKEFDDKLGDALTEVTQQVTSGKKDINRNFLPIYEAAQKLHDIWPTLCEFTTHYEQTMDIDCDNCGVSFLIPSDDKDGDIREKAIKAWNTRADNTALIEKIEGMKITFRLMVLSLLLNCIAFTVNLTTIFEDDLSDKCIVAFTKKTLEDPAWAKMYWEIVAEEVQRKRGGDE